MSDYSSRNLHLVMSQLSISQHCLHPCHYYSYCNCTSVVGAARILQPYFLPAVKRYQKATERGALKISPLYYILQKEKPQMGRGGGDNTIPSNPNIDTLYWLHLLNGCLKVYR